MYNYPQQPLIYRQPQVPVVTSIPSLRVDYTAYPEADAILLKKSFDGIGCDERTVMNVITHRSSAQREQIKSAYNLRFGKSLIDRTVSELYDPLEYLALCLLYTGPDSDAYILKRSTKGLGTHDENLIHILITRSSFQISKIKESYLKMYNKNLVSDVRDDTSGNYKKVLTALIEIPRPEYQCDYNRAKLQATEIYSRSTFGISASEDLIPVFTQSSYAQIRLVGEEFRKQFGKSIANYLENYMGNYEKTIRSIYLFAYNPMAYYASFLRERIMLNDIKGVICIVTTRCEIDLSTILNEYLKIYGSRAEHDIKKAFKSASPMVVKSIEMLFGLTVF